LWVVVVVMLVMLVMLVVTDKHEDATRRSAS
jgi:hypothetical protein